MLNTKHILILLFLALTVNAAAQKTDIIKGVLTDNESKEPIPFANVVVEVKGEHITSCITDFDGNYSLEIPDSLELFLVKFTYVGCKPKTITIDRRKEKEHDKKN